MSAHALKDSALRIVSGEILAGKYRLEAQVGAGAMGIVARAMHLELAQPVAIKFLRPSLLHEKDSVERFLREARSVASLQSEHIARVLDAGRNDAGVPFMVMEFLEGRDLNQVLLQEGPMPVETAVRYVRQACEGLITAHASGIVHRDIKPHNMFLATRKTGRPIVKLVDFGISKVLDQSTVPGSVKREETLTSSGILGTPYYMAPEHMLSAKKADLRSDLWSLGVCLHRFLTGTFPFDADSVIELALKVGRDPPSDPRRFRPDCPDEVAGIIFHALSKNPNDRFQSAEELAAALDAFTLSTSLGGGAAPSGPRLSEMAGLVPSRPSRPSLASLASLPSPVSAPGLLQSSVSEVAMAPATKEKTRKVVATVLAVALLSLGGLLARAAAMSGASRPPLAPVASVPSMIPPQVEVAPDAGTLEAPPLPSAQAASASAATASKPKPSKPRPRPGTVHVDFPGER